MHKINSVMMQYFHWYSPADGTLWKQLAEHASELSKAGITAVWLPPAYKGIAGGKDVGYGVYDMFDLGEFDQKDSLRTKYGTRDEYLNAIKVAQKENIQVYSDIVFNHKTGADQPEEFNATPFDVNNRNVPTGDIKTIKAWTHFTFPGRNKKYSELEWHWWHFNAIDSNELEEDKDVIYLFEGKEFDKDGYPCIFKADYYGAEYKDMGKDGQEYKIVMPSHQWIIDKFLKARKEFAYGDQYDYFDHPNCIGWTRQGDKDNNGGIAVLLSNGEDGHKKMQTPSPNSTYIDITEHINETVLTNHEGWGEFSCLAGSVSVWLPK